MLRADELARALALAPDSRHQFAGRFEEEDRLLTARVDQHPPVGETGQPLHPPDHLRRIVGRFNHVGAADHEFGFRIHAPKGGVAPLRRMILDDFDAGGVPHRDARGLGFGWGAVAGCPGDGQGDRHS